MSLDGFIAAVEERDRQFAVAGEVVCVFDQTQDDIAMRVILDNLEEHRAAAAYAFEANHVHTMDGELLLVDDDQYRFPDRGTLCRGEVRQLVLGALRLYGIDRYRSDGRDLPIEFTDKPGNAQGWLDGIALPPWAMRPAVVLHETAHWIDAIWHYRDPDSGPEAPGHGPRWLGIYLDLVGWHYGLRVAGALGVEGERRGAVEDARLMTDLLASVAVEAFGCHYQRVDRQDFPPAPIDKRAAVHAPGVPADNKSNGEGGQLP